MRANDFDVAIIGGGCAGLSLAERLAGSATTACVIEPRTTYTEDRTWCFWAPASAPPDARERRRWSRWRVSEENGRIAERASENYAYCALSSKKFYDQALDACRASANVSLFLGEKVEKFHGRSRGPMRWRLETSFGPVAASYVVDTRPSNVRQSYGQYFVGFEVKTDGAVFDPDVVDLMAFRPARADRVEFDYVLPFAPDHALIEATVFAARPPSPGDLDLLIEESVRRLTNGRDLSIVRVERGAIGMMARPPRRGSQSTAIELGLRGGAARPSTGFAFQRIQRAAEHAAIQLSRRGELEEFRHDGWATRMMDRLFLSVLRKHPDAGPETFFDLFAKTPRDRLERFLTGSNAATDQLSVIGALPPMKFLRRLAS